MPRANQSLLLPLPDFSRSSDDSESFLRFFFLLAFLSLRILSSELIELMLGERCFEWSSAEPRIEPALHFFTRFFCRSSSCSCTVFTLLISLLRKSNDFNRPPVSFILLFSAIVSLSLLNCVFKVEFFNWKS